VTAPEPLTLAELVRHLGEYDYWLGYDPSGMYVAMPMDADSPVRCGTGSTPWEADDAAELRAAVNELLASGGAHGIERRLQLIDNGKGQRDRLEAAYARVCALAASEGQP